jgi:transcriptional regulator with XRE-family HTH domain
MATFEEKLIAAVVKKREREGLSIRGLATAVGISFSTLARIERGEGQPDNNSKIRLLEWLGPDAEKAGLTFDNVAFVHFRAGKNIRSGTVKTLLRAADCLRQTLTDSDPQVGELEPDEAGASAGISLSKEELEQAAEKFRRDLGLKDDQALDSLRLQVDGVTVVRVSNTNCLPPEVAKRLSGDAGGEWSAMSVPLDATNEHWAVLLNDGHTVERQRVTVLEEFWHILLGHKLTKIARIAEAYGRTYDKAEEHDAYYLASATLLPKGAVSKAVSQRMSSEDIARRFGTSLELVDYRVKRLGLWREHVGKQVKLAPKE